MNGANMRRAQAAWGEALPDWIETLARACDEGSQRLAAERIGYSGSTVNQVLGRSYPGDLGAVESAVRGAWLNATVQCPVEGEIGADLCLQHQRRPFAATNRRRVELYRACRSGCPHSRHKTGETS